MRYHFIHSQDGNPPEDQISIDLGLIEGSAGTITGYGMYSGGSSSPVQLSPEREELKFSPSNESFVDITFNESLNDSIQFSPPSSPVSPNGKEQDTAIPESANFIEDQVIV